MFRTKEDGPCKCLCHDRGGMHIRPCCAYTGQPRASAEAEASKFRGDGQGNHDGLIVGAIVGAAVDGVGGAIIGGILGSLMDD